MASREASEESAVPDFGPQAPGRGSGPEARSLEPGDRGRGRHGAVARPAHGIRVIRVIARLNVGGPGRQIVALSKGLPAHGIETVLALGRVEPGEGDMTDLARETGVEVVEVPGLGRTPRALGDLRAFAALHRLFRARRPAIVHTHTAKAGALGRVAALAAGVPRLVHTFHGHVLEGYFGPLASGALRATERLLASATDAVVCLSPRQRRDLVHRFRALPRGRAVVIPPGLDLAPFADLSSRRGALRAELGAGAAAPILGAVGRLAPVKALDRMIDSFAVVARSRADALLAIAGCGPEREALERRALALGLDRRVRFLGLRRDLCDVYAGLDLLLLSSRNEGTPLAAIEALASGVPVVAFAVGGVPDLVPPSAGVLVRPGDVSALAAAALDLLRDPARRAALAAAGPAAARRFSADALVRAHAALYRRLAHRNAPPIAAIS